MILAMLLMTIMLVKHFVADFLYQPPYQWQNKGTYGHLGGIAHAAQHALLSLVILLFFGPMGVALGLALLEFLVHYHVDWFKMWYNKRMGWGASTHNEFWVLLGVDQLIHGLTYVAMIALILL